MAEVIPSHYLVHTPGLAQAVADYEAAGFCVTWGGPPGEAHNAFVYFDHGGFIELFDPPIGRFAAMVSALGARIGIGFFRRFDRWLSSRGLCDFALEADEPLSASPPAGFGKPRAMSRKQRDGVETHWEVSLPGDAELPFLMGPYEPAPVIDDKMRAHPNRIERLVGIRIGHSKPEAYAESLAAILTAASTEAHGASRIVRVEGFSIVVESSDRIEHRALLADRAPAPDARLHGLRIEAA